MSKTPLKQADQTLVEGAFRAAAAGIGQDGMGQAMDSICLLYTSPSPRD